MLLTMHTTKFSDIHLAHELDFCNLKFKVYWLPFSGLQVTQNTLLAPIYSLQQQI